MSHHDVDSTYRAWLHAIFSLDEQEAVTRCELIASESMSCPEWFDGFEEDALLHFQSQLGQLDENGRKLLMYDTRARLLNRSIWNGIED